jgi:hypothetical protein
MEIPTSFWVPGYMPVQLLLVFGVALAAFESTMAQGRPRLRVAMGPFDGG